MKIFKKALDKLDDSTFLQKFHGWFTVIWFVAAFPVCIWLNQSVPFLVFISVYAIVISHWSAWQAARIEVKDDAKEEAENENAGEDSRG